MIKTLNRLKHDEQGATAIEYGLIVSLVVIACIGAFDAVANENTGIWATTSSAVVGAISSVEQPS